VNEDGLLDGLEVGSDEGTPLEIIFGGELGSTEGITKVVGLEDESDGGTVV